jgi:hypothetical protein
MDKHPVAWLKKRISLLDIALGLAVTGLYLTSFHSYLLFHTLAEILRVSMAVAIFMLALNVRNSLDNSSLLFISAAYVFVCGLEILHALASQGLGAFLPMSRTWPPSCGSRPDTWSPFRSSWLLFS